MLDNLEKKVDRKVFSILQLRYHPNVKKLKKLENENKVYDIDLTYITARAHGTDIHGKEMIKSQVA